jgi:hypothetical protein
MGLATLQGREGVYPDMTVLARIVAWIVSLAALVAAVEAILRLVRFAWSLVVRLTQALRANPRPWVRFAAC